MVLVDSVVTAREWGGGSEDRGGAWRIRFCDYGFGVDCAHGSARYAGIELDGLRVRARGFRPAVVVRLPEGGECRHRLRRRAARELARLLHRHRDAGALRPSVDEVVGWVAIVDGVVASARDNGRWIAEQQVVDLEASRPAKAENIPSRLADCFAPAELEALGRWAMDLRAEVARANEDIAAKELVDRKRFFDTIEKRPLTEEQARAVLCMDNRVLVVAAAGSGKTSVMVARAAYAISRGFVQADRVLLLAFNTAAAKELQQRVGQRLGVAGICADGIVAKTFHSFGLSVIGDATGRRPRLASWLDGKDDGMGKLGAIVTSLVETSPDFRLDWDLFRLIYPGVTEEMTSAEPDRCDKDGTARYDVPGGPPVRSQGEQIIARWLWFNHVEYEYEKSYPLRPDDKARSAYHPDFYYPASDVWHEHWALDFDGNPPAEFVGYREGMEWKQALHQRHGNRFAETTWAQIMSPSGLRDLECTLRAHGIDPRWDPDRETEASPEFPRTRLLALVRTFMKHVKGRGLTRDQLQALAESRRVARLPRTQLFLRLYLPIHDRWQAELAHEGAVDFEDMLLTAAEALENGRAPRNYDMVLVDEFQDTSQVRARVVRALVADPGKHLLAVGDDWQSINRFAGADVSVMTGFEDFFGPGPTLRLQATFRCPASISDVASEFVGRNPQQLTKTVVSAVEGPGAPVRLLAAKRQEDVEGLVDEYLRDVAARHREDIEEGRRISVFLLGRYRFEQDRLAGRYPAGLDVVFRTIHGVKGLEADYVVVLGMTRDRRYGFPSKVEDDPVLQVVMAEGEPFPHAEERRLLYVALTRARREAVLLTVYGQESEFVTELLKAGRLAPPADYGQVPQVCPACREGVLVLRTGPYGEFWSCNRVPRCWGKQAAGPAREATRPTVQPKSAPHPSKLPARKLPKQVPREAKPDANGTVAQIARARWGIAVRSTVSRFGQTGWSYRETVIGACQGCAGDLHVLRKPYISGGRPYEYSALVCAPCSRVVTLQDLGFKTYPAFVRGRRTRGDE